MKLAAVVSNDKKFDDERVDVKMFERKISWKKKTAALIVAGTIAVSGFAVGAPAPAYADQASITISQKANADAQYDAYRLFTASISEEDKATNVQWDTSVGDKKNVLISFLQGAGYDTWLMEQGHGTGESGEVQQGDRENPQNALEFISKSISESQSSGSHTPRWVDAKTFADKLAKTVKENISPVGTATQGQAYTAEEGYYLFLSKASTVSGIDMATLPIWVSVGGSVDTVEEKATPATITKEVKEDSNNQWGGYADAEIGQKVDYRIQVTIPGNYNGFTSFYAGVTDTLPIGMTLETNDVKVYVGKDSSGTDVTGKFAINYVGHTLTVINEDTKDSSTGVPELAGGSTLTIEYKAKLVEPDAVYGGGGNRNTAYFEFSNDPNSTTRGKTSEVDARLFSYIVTVDKLDAATKEALAGAQFVIKNKDDKYLKNGAWTGASVEDAQKFITDDKGEINGIKGLDANETYTLTEVAAPDGYALPANRDITITVRPTYDENGDSVTALEAEIGCVGNIANVDGEASDGNAGTVGIDVKNDKNVSLAMTGGAGVGVGGAAVLAIGLGWWIVRNHRKSAE